MFNPFTWWSNYRLRRLELQLASANKPMEALIAAVTSQQDLLKEWLLQFRVTELPSSTVMRDEDSWLKEHPDEVFGPGNDSHPHLSPRVQQSIQNALKADAFPALADLLS